MASILASWDGLGCVFGAHFGVLEWSWMRLWGSFLRLWDPFWRPGSGLVGGPNRLSVPLIHLFITYKKKRGASMASWVCLLGSIFDVLEWSWMCLWGSFWRLWGPFWRPGMVLGVSLASIFASWDCLGCVFGVHFGVLEWSWMCLWCTWRRLWGPFCRPGVALLGAQIGYKYL